VGCVWWEQVALLERGAGAHVCLADLATHPILESAEVGLSGRQPSARFRACGVVLRLIREGIRSRPWPESIALARIDETFGSEFEIGKVVESRQRTPASSRLTAAPGQPARADAPAPWR